MPLPTTRQAARAARACVAALVLSLATPAIATSGERITSFAAGATELYALRGNTVVTFDAGGREIARCPRFEAALPPRPPAPAVGPIDAQETLRLAGLPDDDFQTPEAEEVLAAEGLATRRRARLAPVAAVVAHSLAASATADDVWIAASVGLYRGRAGGCARVALPGRDVIAVAAAGDAIAAATTDLLWRSTDGGGTFRVVAGLVARPRALAIVDDERTVVADDDSIVEIGPAGTSRTVLDRGGAAVAVCGGLALAFAEDGAWTWHGDDPAERVGDRPPARTVACGDGGAARFIATGDSLFASTDGASWRERRAVPGRSVAAAAIGNRIWLAADDGVVALDDLSASTFDALPGLSAAPTLPALPALRTRQLAEPVFPWPQLTVVFTQQRTPLREGWSLVALLVFRLGRVAVAQADGRRLAAELVARDAALAAQEIELAAVPNDDPSRTALLRAIRQEREALR